MLQFCDDESRRDTLSEGISRYADAVDVRAVAAKKAVSKAAPILFSFI